MKIQMIGIDHNTANVDIRALFSFTRKNAGEAMEQLKQKEGILGCVMLSTCNRLEIWASTRKDEVPLYEYLCEIKGIDSEQYEEYIKTRTDQKAVEHLFYLTAGLKSQILGEDQILTQVKDSLNLAREHFVTDSVLEVLFRMAITAGKKIKTEIPFAHGNPSVIHHAIRKLQKEGYSVSGKTCMVIGNGEMGKVAAQTLMDAGADVSVTVRQYRSGIVDIPRGCRRLPYSERLEYLPQCDFVVSATASPNYTLTMEQVESVIQNDLMMIDLAVPRDLDPEISKLSQVTLYDMDSFDTTEEWEEQKDHLEAARVIVREQMSEFYQWLEGRKVIPRIQELQQDAAMDLNLRIQKIFQKTLTEEEEREMLLNAVNAAAGKVIGKLIFGLRDHLSPDTFMECVEGLEKIYEE